MASPLFFNFDIVPSSKSECTASSAVVILASERQLSDALRSGFALSDLTSGPPLFTIHKCRVCGSYLHGMCGLPDPFGNNEIQRVCHGCVNSNNRKESSADPADGSLARLNVDSDDDEVDSSAGDKSQCTQPVLSPRPQPYTDVARQFGDLEGIAERCSMAGVPYHLRKAKLAWMSEAGSKKTKQTCMADFV